MVEKKLSITNRLGLHLRAASQLAKVASKFSCRITLKNHNGKADGKSLISLIGLGAAGGTEVTVRADGKEEQTALSEIQDLFQANFGEVASGAR